MLEQNKAVEHQPDPKQGKRRVLDLVKMDLIARAETGNERYGTYLETHNGRDALWDLYQELLDASMYVRQVIGELPDYYIWWTSQRACREIDQLDIVHLPEYIQTEFTSRNGRNGRGRLWVADHIDIEEIEWLEKPGAWLAAECGGIVIDPNDLKFVFKLPGFVTDLELSIINEIQ
jgi:hypothetical protein